MMIEHLAISRAVVVLQALKSSCSAILFVAANAGASAAIATLFPGRSGDIVVITFFAGLMLLGITKEPARTFSHFARRRSTAVQLAGSAALALLGLAPGFLIPEIEGPVFAGVASVFAVFAWATLRLAASVHRLEAELRSRTPAPAAEAIDHLSPSREMPEAADAQDTRPMGRSKPRNLVVSLIASLLGLCLPLVLLTTYDKIAAEAALGIYPEIAVRVVLIAAMLFGLYGLMRLAYLFFRPDAARIVARRSGDVTLLLRSFADEGKSYRRLFANYRLEDLLDWELGSRTFFVAIGDPREIVPKLGALRTYSSDESWQDVFKTFVAECSTVVAVAGDTPWLGWELRTLDSLHAAGKLVVVFPEVSSDTKRRHIEIVAGAIGALEPVRHLTGIDTIRCIAVRTGSGPVVVTCVSGSKSAMRVALALALRLGERL